MAEEVKEQTISLLDQIKEVVKAREQRFRLGMAKQRSYEQWLDTNLELMGQLAIAENQVAEQETLLRELTVRAYNETGSKQPAPGVSVKLFQILDYDPKEALKWAMSHQVSLSLDKKSFESLAKATPIECVTISEEPRAQIATDLSKVLEEKEVK